MSGMPSLQIPSLAGGVAQYFISKEQAHLDNEAKERAFRMQSDRQEAFQREMSGSVFQRAAADMRLAGLNPILAAGGSGSPSPSGSSASLQASGPDYSSVVSSAAQLSSLVNQFRSTDAAVRAADAGILKTAAETATIQAELPGVSSANRLKELNNKIAELQAQNLRASNKATDLGMEQTREAIREMKALNERLEGQVAAERRGGDTYRDIEAATKGISLFK